MVYNCLRKWHWTLLPAHCLLCRGRARPPFELCPGCIADLPRPAAICPRCGAPASAARLCGHCQRQPPSFHRARAAYLYAPPVDYLLHALKYRGQLAVARTLGELLYATLQDELRVMPDRVVPIPLHPTRLRSRGFNQAAELARRVARRADLILDTRCVARTRATAPQTQLSERARRGNVRNAFRVVAHVAGERILLIDDVMTTGNTVNEVARALVAAGAQRIDVWTVARA